MANAAASCPTLTAKEFDEAILFSLRASLLVMEHLVVTGNATALALAACAACALSREIAGGGVRLALAPSGRLQLQALKGRGGARQGSIG